MSERASGDDAGYYLRYVVLDWIVLKLDDDDNDDDVHHEKLPFHRVVKVEVEVDIHIKNFSIISSVQFNSFFVLCIFLCVGGVVELNMQFICTYLPKYLPI